LQVSVPPRARMTTYNEDQLINNDSLIRDSL
jgi:hypothetical protein